MGQQLLLEKIHMGRVNLQFQLLPGHGYRVRRRCAEVKRAGDGMESGFQFVFQVVDIDSAFLELGIPHELSMQRNVGANAIDQ